MISLQREDIIKYLIKIQLNFENSYVTASDFERELLVESWYEALNEYPKELCDKAVNNSLKKAKFAPRLGDITEEIERLMKVDEPSDEELWAKLSSVLGDTYQISRYLAYPQHYTWASGRLDEIYNKLDERLKLFVVNRSTLIELSEMSEESLHYERARFFKQMPILKKHAEDKADARKFLAQTSSMQSLPKGNLRIKDKNDSKN